MLRCGSSFRNIVTPKVRRHKSWNDRKMKLFKMSFAPFHHAKSSVMEEVAESKLIGSFCAHKSCRQAAKLHKCLEYPVLGSSSKNIRSSFKPSLKHLEENYLTEQLSDSNSQVSIPLATLLRPSKLKKVLIPPNSEPKLNFLNHFLMKNQQDIPNIGFPYTVRPIDQYFQDSETNNFRWKNKNIFNKKVNYMSSFDQCILNKYGPGLQNGRDLFRKHLSLNSLSEQPPLNELPELKNNKKKEISNMAVYKNEDDCSNKTKVFVNKQNNCTQTDQVPNKFLMKNPSCLQKGRENEKNVPFSEIDCKKKRVIDTICGKKNIKSEDNIYYIILKKRNAALHDLITRSMEKNRDTWSWLSSKFGVLKNKPIQKDSGMETPGEPIPSAPNYHGEMNHRTFFSSRLNDLNKAIQEVKGRIENWNESTANVKSKTKKDNLLNNLKTDIINKNENDVNSFISKNNPVKKTIDSMTAVNAPIKKNLKKLVKKNLASRKLFQKDTIGNKENKCINPKVVLALTKLPSNVYRVEELDYNKVKINKKSFIPKKRYGNTLVWRGRKMKTRNQKIKEISLGKKTRSGSMPCSLNKIPKEYPASLGGSHQMLLHSMSLLTNPLRAQPCLCRWVSTTASLAIDGSKKDNKFMSGTFFSSANLNKNDKTTKQVKGEKFIKYIALRESFPEEPEEPVRTEFVAKAKKKRISSSRINKMLSCQQIENKEFTAERSTQSKNNWIQYESNKDDPIVDKCLVNDELGKKNYEEIAVKNEFHDYIPKKKNSGIMKKGLTKITEGLKNTCLEYDCQKRVPASRKKSFRVQDTRGKKLLVLKSKKVDSESDGEFINKINKTKQEKFDTDLEENKSKACLEYDCRKNQIKTGGKLYLKKLINKNNLIYDKDVNPPVNPSVGHSKKDSETFFKDEELPQKLEKRKETNDEDFKILPRTMSTVSLQDDNDSMLREVEAKDNFVTFVKQGDHIINKSNEILSEQNYTCNIKKIKPLFEKCPKENGFEVSEKVLPQMSRGINQKKTHDDLGQCNENMNRPNDNGFKVHSSKGNSRALSFNNNLNNKDELKNKTELNNIETNQNKVSENERLINTSDVSQCDKIYDLKEKNIPYENEENLNVEFRVKQTNCTSCGENEKKVKNHEYNSRFVSDSSDSVACKTRMVRSNENKDNQSMQNLINEQNKCLETELYTGSIGNENKSTDLDTRLKNARDNIKNSNERLKRIIQVVKNKNINSSSIVNEDTNSSSNVHMKKSRIVSNDEKTKSEKNLFSEMGDIEELENWHKKRMSEEFVGFVKEEPTTVSAKERKEEEKETKRRIHEFNCNGPKKKCISNCPVTSFQSNPLLPNNFHQRSRNFSFIKPSPLKPSIIHVSWYGTKQNNANDDEMKSEVLNKIKSLKEIETVKSSIEEKKIVNQQVMEGTKYVESYHKKNKYDKFEPTIHNDHSVSQDVSLTSIDDNFPNVHKDHTVTLQTSKQLEIFGTFNDGVKKIHGKMTQISSLPENSDEVLKKDTNKTTYNFVEKCFLNVDENNKEMYEATNINNKYELEISDPTNINKCWKRTITHNEEKLNNTILAQIKNDTLDNRIQTRFNEEKKFSDVVNSSKSVSEATMVTVLLPCGTKKTTFEVVEDLTLHKDKVNSIMSEIHSPLPLYNGKYLDNKETGKKAFSAFSQESHSLSQSSTPEINLNKSGVLNKLNLLKQTVVNESHNRMQQLKDKINEDGPDEKEVSHKNVSKEVKVNSNNEKGNHLNYSTQNSPVPLKNNKPSSELNSEEEKLLKSSRKKDSFNESADINSSEELNIKETDINVKIYGPVLSNKESSSAAKNIDIKEQIIDGNDQTLTDKLFFNAVDINASFPTVNSNLSHFGQVKGISKQANSVSTKVDSTNKKDGPSGPKKSNKVTGPKSDSEKKDPLIKRLNQTKEKISKLDFLSNGKGNQKEISKDQKIQEEKSNLINKLFYSMEKALSKSILGKKGEEKEEVVKKSISNDSQKKNAASDSGSLKKDSSKESEKRQFYTTFEDPGFRKQKPKVKKDAIPQQGKELSSFHDRIKKKTSKEVPKPVQKRTEVSNNKQNPKMVNNALPRIPKKTLIKDNSLKKMPNMKYKAKQKYDSLTSWEKRFAGQREEKLLREVHSEESDNNYEQIKWKMKVDLAKRLAGTRDEECPSRECKKSNWVATVLSSDGQNGQKTNSMWPDLYMRKGDSIWVKKV